FPLPFGLRLGRSEADELAPPLAARRFSAVLHGWERSRERRVAARIRQNIPRTGPACPGSGNTGAHHATLLVDARARPRFDPELLGVGTVDGRFRHDRAPLPRLAQREIRGSSTAAVVRE